MHLAKVTARQYALPHSSHVSHMAAQSAENCRRQYSNSKKSFLKASRLNNDLFDNYEFLSFSSFRWPQIVNNCGRLDPHEDKHASPMTMMGENVKST